MTVPMALRTNRILSIEYGLKATKAVYLRLDPVLKML